MPDLTHARQLMIDRQLARRGIRDDRVLSAMREVPREAFVSAEMAKFAYEDLPLPIEAEQTISQPYIVALMLQAAELKPDSRALEIGTGSGYSAAILSRVCREVFTIERHAELAHLARERLEALGCDNVTVRIGDGTRGWPEHGPFDVIIAAAGGPSVPDALRVQLAEGGRLIMPVGATAHAQRLIRLTRVSNSEFGREDLGGVSFVPLIGAYGWSEDKITGEGRPGQREACGNRHRRPSPRPRADARLRRRGAQKAIRPAWRRQACVARIGELRDSRILSSPRGDHASDNQLLLVAMAHSQELVGLWRETYNDHRRSRRSFTGTANATPLIAQLFRFGRTTGA